VYSSLEFALCFGSAKAHSVATKKKTVATKKNDPGYSVSLVC